MGKHVLTSGTLVCERLNRSVPLCRRWCLFPHSPRFNGPHLLLYFIFKCKPRVLFGIFSNIRLKFNAMLYVA